VGGIGGEITTQYILRYIPDVDADAKPKAFRSIKVDIPGLPNVKISARDGYYPNDVPPGPAASPASPPAAETPAPAKNLKPKGFVRVRPR